MSSNMPPIPAENRSPKGTGSAPNTRGKEDEPTRQPPEGSQTGQAANTRINNETAHRLQWHSAVGRSSYHLRRLAFPLRAIQVVHADRACLV